MRNFIHFYGNGFLGANPLIRTNKHGKEFAVVCLAVNHSPIDVPTDWLWVTTSSNLEFVRTLRIGDHLSFFGRIKRRQGKAGCNLIADVMTRVERYGAEEREGEFESVAEAVALENAYRIPENFKV